MSLPKVSNIQTSVLFRLGEYKYLTLKQLLRIGIGTDSYKYLWKQVMVLIKRKRPLLQRVKFNTIDRVGRVEDIYYLTRDGAKFLVDLGMPIEGILLPKGTVLSAKDYYHRKWTLDFQIEVLLWSKLAGIEVQFFKRYFDKKGNNRRDGNLNSITRVEISENRFIIPDAIFKLKLDGFERLFLFELHNGRDHKRLFVQVENHLQLLLSLKVHEKFNYPVKRSYYILILFAEESTMKGFLKRMSDHSHKYQNFEKYFLCKSIDSIHNIPFDESWVSVLGNPAELTIKPIRPGLR